MDPLQLVQTLNTEASPESNQKYPWPPPALMGTINKLLVSFASADEYHRRAFTAALDDRVKMVLHKYAWVMAENAVRQNKPELLMDGLLAVALKNGPSDDPRHDAIVVAMLFNSARRLGVDAATLFARPTGLIANTWLNDFVRTFPSRTAEHSDLRKNFLIEETFNKNGFYYERGPWSPLRKVWEQIRRLFNPNAVPK